MVKPCISLKTKSKEQFGPHLVNFKNYFVDEKSFIHTRICGMWQRSKVLMRFKTKNRRRFQKVFKEVKCIVPELFV